MPISEIPVLFAPKILPSPGLRTLGTADRGFLASSLPEACREGEVLGETVPGAHSSMSEEPETANSGLQASNPESSRVRLAHVMDSFVNGWRSSRPASAWNGSVRLSLDLR